VCREIKKREERERENGEVRRNEKES